MKILVIIPTYNERENIVPLLEELNSKYPAIDVLVVDDSSPDGTGALVKEYSKEHSNVSLLSREGKEGLGKAYIAGFKWGLSKKYEILVEMDADFSHNPNYLKSMIDSFPEADFVMGSRWVPGGGTINWGLGRQFISRGGSFYSKLILGYPVNDWTGGFNAWKAEVLQSIGLDQIQSEGYSFQIELKFKALKRGFKMKEVPIIFEDRRVGHSKMSTRIVLEALYKVWMIRFLF